MKDYTQIEHINKYIEERMKHCYDAGYEQGRKDEKEVHEGCGYYETPNRQVEGRWNSSDDILGRDNSGTQWSVPRKYTNEEINDRCLAFGVCKCELPLGYGHVFKKSDYPNGIINFKCVYCGEDGQLMFNPLPSDS